MGQPLEPGQVARLLGIAAAAATAADAAAPREREAGLLGFSGRYAARTLQAAGRLRLLGGGWRDPLSPGDWAALARAFLPNAARTGGEEFANYLEGLVLLSGGEDASGGSGGMGGGGGVGACGPPPLAVGDAAALAAEALSLVQGAPVPASAAAAGGGGGGFLGSFDGEAAATTLWALEKLDVQKVRVSAGCSGAERASPAALSGLRLPSNTVLSSSKHTLPPPLSRP